MDKKEIQKRATEYEKEELKEYKVKMILQRAVTAEDEDKAREYFLEMWDLEINFDLQQKAQIIVEEVEEWE